MHAGVLPLVRRIRPNADCHCFLPGPVAVCITRMQAEDVPQDLATLTGEATAARHGSVVRARWGGSVHWCDVS